MIKFWSDLHQGLEDVWLEQDQNLEFLEGMFEKVLVISNFDLVSILKAV